MPLLNQTATTPSTGTSKDNLISDTRGLIEGYDHTETAQRNTARQIADNLAMLRDQHNMTQTDLGKVFGKAQGWVSGVLAWYEGGFKTDTPFGVSSKAARKRAKARPAKYQATDKSSRRKTTSEPNRLFAVVDTFFKTELAALDDQAFDGVMKMFAERRQAAKTAKATPTFVPPAIDNANKVVNAILASTERARKRARKTKAARRRRQLKARCSKPALMQRRQMPTRRQPSRRISVRVTEPDL